MPPLRSICVFCGSSPEVDDVFVTAARELGRLLAGQNRTIVYGGGRIGLMGALADAATAAGGEVIGVIPRSLLEREVGHQGLSKLHVVSSMHERKAMMAELSDGFVTLPGGIGTLEEFFEIWTWAQLGLHHKPFGLLNVAGFFDPLLAFLDELSERRFLRREHRAMLSTRPVASDLIQAMTDYLPIDTWKWLTSAES
jgi:uncharacterized protein (TIGR00730 family)